VDGRHEINMVKIIMEGKEMNEKNQSAYYGCYYRLCNQTPQVAIHIHIQAECYSPKKAT
jgi:hypothetical protein